MSLERIDLLTISKGVVSVDSAFAAVNNNFGYRTRFEIPQIGPGSIAAEIEKAKQDSQFITERETSKTFYRLGNEFHSEESLKLIASFFPDDEVRQTALNILSGIDK